MTAVESNIATNVVPNDIGFITLSTRKLKLTLEYFNEVLGLPLVALEWTDEEKKSAVATLKMSDSSLLMINYSEQNPNDIEYGLTHAGDPAGKCASGTMQHLAFNVDTLDELLQVRSRIRSKNVFCVGPLDHGFVHSIYFSGPEGMMLEVAAFSGENLDMWVDSKVVSSIDITDRELYKLTNGRLGCSG
ncbi:hypothetical protein R50073_12840 [Maricurvus nonylphenolicus]|uniref:VOC family protein n=1 Tax=Maricurvus nonylphenolicus TaxID=1008307 RepID=UPI0036F2577D